MGLPPRILPAERPSVIESLECECIADIVSEQASETTSLMSTRSLSDLWLYAARIAYGIAQAAEDDRHRLLWTSPPRGDGATNPNSSRSEVSLCFAKLHARPPQASLAGFT